MGSRSRLVLAAATVVIAAIALPTGAALAAPSQPGAGGQNPQPPVTTQPTQPTQATTTAPAPTTAPTVVATTPAPTPAEIAAAAAAQAAALKAAQEAAALKAAQEAAAKAAAEAQRKAAEAAAKLAAQTALAAQRGQATWAAHGKPAKLAIVHQTSIDTFSNGQLVAHLVRSGTALTIGALDDILPAGWLTVDNGRVQLDAAVILTDGTSLTLSGVDTVALAGGPDVRNAAFLYTGTGRIRVQGVTLTSFDPGTNQAVAPTAAGRPYITVASGGRLDATDATISDLGTPITDDGGGNAALAFRKGSTGSVVHTTLTRNTIGLSLSKSRGVRLDDISVTRSAGSGIILFADTATTLQAVHADDNGDVGVAVSGDGDARRDVSGISAARNARYGVAVTGQKNATIHDITTEKNVSGGLELNRLTDPTVRDVATNNEPQGVFVHGYSTNVTLDKLALRGGRTAVHVDKSTTGLHITNTSVDGPQVGFSLGGKTSALEGVSVHNATTALKFERLAEGLSLTGLSVLGGVDGVVLAGSTKGVVIKDLSTDGVSNNAVRDLSDGMRMTGGQIRGGRTGMDIEGDATITGTTLGLTGTGLRIRTPKAVAITGIRVDAVSLGMDMEQSGAVSVRNSTIHALESLRGTPLAFENNDVSLPPLNLLGAIGVPLLLLAVTLELVHLVRSRKVRRQGTGGGRRAMPPPVLVGAR